MTQYNVVTAHSQRSSELFLISFLLDSLTNFFFLSTIFAPAIKPGEITWVYYGFRYCCCVYSIHIFVPREASTLSLFFGSHPPYVLRKAPGTREFLKRYVEITLHGSVYFFLSACVLFKTVLLYYIVYSYKIICRNIFLMCLITFCLHYSVNTLQNIVAEKPMEGENKITNKSVFKQCVII